MQLVYPYSVIMINIIKKPIWFVLFILLAICNIFLFLLINHELTQNEEESVLSEKISVQFNDKLILNESTIAKYLPDDRYTKLSIEDHKIKIVSTTNMLNKEVKTTMITKPDVEVDGTLKLHIEQISIGQLPLNKKQQLQLVKKFGKLPDDVTLSVKQSALYYHMGIIKKNGTKLVLKSITDDNKWVFDIELGE